MRNIKQKGKLFFLFNSVKLVVCPAMILLFICYAEGAKIVDFSASDLKAGGGAYKKCGRIPKEWIADGNDIASEIPFGIRDDECFFNKMYSYPSGFEQEILSLDINTAAFTLINGIDLPEGNHTVGETGWLVFDEIVDLNEGPGEYEFIVEIKDKGDPNFDSVLLIDNIRFR